MNPQAIEVALDHNDTLVAGGRRTVEIKYLPRFAETDRKFFYKVVDAQLTFDVDPQGAGTQVTLHQNGRDNIAKRLSEAR